MYSILIRHNTGGDPEVMAQIIKWLMKAVAISTRSGKILTWGYSKKYGQEVRLDG